MIGGVIIIFVAVWMYQAAIEAKKQNAFLWVALGALVFFIVQYFMVSVNVYILESIKDSQSGGMLEDRPLTSVKSDKMDGFVGLIFSLFMELAPPFIGVVAAGFFRMMVILKQPFQLGNLFGGIKVMFVKIKESFKVTE